MGRTYLLLRVCGDSVLCRTYWLLGVFTTSLRPMIAYTTHHNSSYIILSDAHILPPPLAPSKQLIPCDPNACKGRSGLARCKCSSRSKYAFCESMLAAQLAAASRSREDQNGSSLSLGKCGTWASRRGRSQLCDVA